MALLISFACIPIFLVQICSTAPSSHLCDEKTQYEKWNKCCNLCAPGSKLKAECSATSDTECTECTSEEYQAVYNRDKNCLVHRYCDANAGFEVVSEGNKEKDTVCWCKERSHCSGTACETCVKDSPCSPGHMVIKKSDRVLDTQCAPCPEGTFSSVFSFNENCTPWVRCVAPGQMQKMPGSSMSDAVCGPSEENTSKSLVTSIMIPVGIFMFFAILIGILWHTGYMKRCIERMKKEQPQAQHQGVQVIPENRVPILHPMEDEEDDGSTRKPIPETLSDGLMPVQQEVGKDSRTSVEATDRSIS